MASPTLHAQPHTASSAFPQAALNYTDSQKQDLLLLRRLFYSKMGQLSRERDALLGQMPAASATCQPSQPAPFGGSTKQLANSKAAEPRTLTDLLYANRVEESRAYMYGGFVLHRCVRILPLTTNLCLSTRQSSVR